MSTGNSYLPAKEADTLGWLENFVTVATNNQTGLPITIAEINDLSDTVTDFGVGLQSVETAHAAAKTATQTKDAARKLSVAKARILVKKIQASPAVAAVLKTQLRITVSSGEHKPLPVFAPAKAVASMEAGGIVSVAWDTNGNAPGAVYVIEASTSLTGGWTFVNAQTASRFFTDNSGANAAICYRIKASRGTRVSDYSNIAVVGGS